MSLYWVRLAEEQAFPEVAVVTGSTDPFSCVMTRKKKQVLQVVVVPVCYLVGEDTPLDKSKCCATRTTVVNNPRCVALDEI